MTAAIACVRAALDEGTTTFDTADIYANTKAEEVLGKALAAGEGALSTFTTQSVSWMVISC
jgi:aryl-alcohol dehydrogenase-like predicted oxidoreductase